MLYLRNSGSNPLLQKGISSHSLSLELVTYEGMAPHNVPVIVECMTENRNRTAPDLRSLWRDGQFGSKVTFLFDHRGIVEATHSDPATDAEAAAIEAGAQDVETLDGVPEGQVGARFLTDRGDLDTVAASLRQAGWKVSVAELGYVPKDAVQLTPEQRAEVEAFLERIDDHDDVHRIYTALA